MKRVIIVLALAGAAALPAYAQFGGLGGMLGGAKTGSGGGDVGAMAGEFVKDNEVIREAVSYSLAQIVAALGDKDQIAIIKTRTESLAKTTDAKEAGSIQGQLITEQGAVAQMLLESADGRARMEKLSPEMQIKVSKSILAVGVASLRIPGMLDKGKRVIEGVGMNPLNIAKAAPVKDGLSMFADNAPKIAKIAASGFKLMQDVKVQAPKPTAETKLEASKDVTFPS